MSCIWCVRERWRHGEVCLGDMCPFFLPLPLNWTVDSFFSSGWLLPGHSCFSSFRMGVVRALSCSSHAREPSLVAAKPGLP